VIDVDLVGSEISARGPELRWLVDPDDYLRPMAYDPDNPHWFIPERHRRVAQFCHR
jgi:hypothetical protein